MSFYADHKQIIDQAAHAAAGFAVVLLMKQMFPALLALVLAMLIGFARELWQHKWDPEEMGPGSYMDLAFIGMGGLLAAVV